MQWFTGCTTAAEIKARYRTLAYEHHPDRGGDTAIMQQINAAYDAACKAAQRQERPDKTESAYDFYATADTAVREAISRIITLPDIEIEVCGWWVWVSGNTREVKEQLKAAGYRWSREKGTWYFPGCPSGGKGKYSMDDIRSTYGSQRVQTKPRTALDEQQ